MILLHRLRATNFKQMENVDLAFPTSGTFLIEGRNEAGKSTLFEAIFYALYGKVVGEGDVPGAIRYGCDNLEVTLDFSIEGRNFSVTRKHGQRATALLTFPGADGQTERVASVTGVNKQIIEEMNLSPQGLLNTCFVEQKKLEHLESLKKDEREKAINELVNLSAFDRIVKDFPSEAEENRRENAARGHLLIAELDSKYAGLQTMLSNLRPLHAAAQLGTLDTAQELCRQNLSDLAARKATIERLIALRERDGWINNTVRPALALLEAAETTESQTRTAVTESETAQKRLPLLKSATARLADLETMLALYLRHKEDEMRHSDWAASQQTANAEAARLKTALAEAKQEWEEAQNALSATEKYAALTEWAQAKTALGAALLPSLDPQLTALIAAVEKAKTACETAKQRADAAESAAQTAEQNARKVSGRTRTEIGGLQKEPDEAAPPDAALIPAAVPVPPAGNKTAAGAGLAALGLACAIAAFVTGLWVLLAPAVLLIGGGSTLVAAQNKAQNAHAHAVRLHEEREAKRGEAVRKAQEAVRAAREAARAEIARLQKADDEAQDTARTMRETATGQAQAHNAALILRTDAERKLADYRIQNDVSARLPGLRQVLARAEAELQSLELPIPPTVDEAVRRAGTVPRLPKDRLRQRVNETRQAYDTMQKALSAAQAKIVPFQPLHTFTDEQEETIGQTLRRLQEANFTVDPALLRASLNEATHAQQEAERLTGLLPARQADWQTAAQKTNERKETFRQIVGSGDTDALFPKLQAASMETAAGARDYVEQMQKGVREKEAKQDGALRPLSLDDLRKAKDTVTGNEGAVQKELNGLIAQEDAPRQTLGRDSADRVSLADLLPGVRQEYPEAFTRNAADWNEHIAKTETETHQNRAKRSAHADEAQITDAILDEAIERVAYEACLFARAVNAQAKRIIALAREAILNRVMPGTLQITKRILPHLTENRYRDVRWDMNLNLLEVMDARKGDWAMKKVFSGGTRDQISLALRLSFVLATLPDQKATRPGWLFLDEPLSSFDAARSESLVKLLTQGNLIRPRFPQIFLISHGVAADPSRFDYHLVMDGGKISSASRLPAP